MKYVWVLVFLSMILVFLSSYNVEAAPPPVDVYEKHRDYVDSIKLQQEKPTPLEQMKNQIQAHTVMCNNDFVLLLKWTSNKSACVSPQTAEKLIERNWGVYAKDVNVLNFPDNPYEFFAGAAASISFEYDDENKHYETKLIKKLREKITEHYKELGWSRDHIWAYMTIKKSEDHFTLSIAGGMNEDTLQSILEKIEGVSNIENYRQPFA